MNKVFDVVSGIGVLIAVYLFLSNSAQTTSIINTIATNTTSGIRVLQGRG